MDTLVNVTKAEYMKLKELKALHVWMIITAVAAYVFGMLAYKFISWQNKTLVDSGLGDLTGGTSLDLSTSTYGLLGLLLIIIGIAQITAHEYKSNAHIVTQTYVPQREYEYAAKFIVAYTYYAAWTVFILCIGFAAAFIHGPKEMRQEINLFTDGGILILKYLIILLFYVLIVQGLAYMFKSSSLASTVVIAYLFVVENAIGMIPEYGSKIRPYMPKSSMDNLISWGNSQPDVHIAISAAIIIGLTLVLYIGGTMYNKKSDA